MTPNRKSLTAILLAAMLLLSTVGTARPANTLWGDKTTDEDNQQNPGWGGADGDLDGVYAATLLYGKTTKNFTPPTGDKYEVIGDSYYYPYVCASHAVAPIEFDILIPQGDLQEGGSLTVYTYWVRPGEISHVYLNSTYMGILTPTGEKEHGSTIFPIAPGSNTIYDGRNNRVTVVPYTGTCTDVTGGTIHLISPRASIRGLVFVDKNRNGVYDEGEKGFPGATIHFFVEGREVVGPPLTSGDDGTYGLVQAEWGDWMVEMGVPAGYVPTSPTSQQFHLEGIDTFMGVNFGIAHAPTPTPAPTPTRTRRPPTPTPT